MKKIAGNGASKMFGGLRTPSLSQTSITTQMKTDLGPRVANNVMDPRIKTGAAKVRSAQTGGAVVKPW